MYNPFDDVAGVNKLPYLADEYIEKMHEQGKSKNISKHDILNFIYIKKMLNNLEQQSNLKQNEAIELLRCKPREGMLGEFVENLSRRSHIYYRYAKKK